MEDLTSLSIACRHMNTECRDMTYTKLRKQKHAAHSQTHRLKQKLATMELANKLLTVCWISMTRESRVMRGQIAEYIREVRQIGDNEDLSL